MGPRGYVCVCVGVYMHTSTLLSYIYIPVCVYAEVAGKESLSGDHTLARRHQLMEGRAFDVLAKAFKEDGTAHASYCFLLSSHGYMY